MPDAVGVPLMVITLAAHAAVTPAGNPVAAPMPVAPVVACVILVNAVLIHNVGVDDGAPAVFSEQASPNCVLMVEIPAVKLFL